ncbi:phosphotransferase [Tumebacillus permanentifrigoris]|uniref:Ser/Thr protein kinase RdoA (MazF antagonist) n=1 Tax=Tumebacillus permanentifrigoris TaxID=378543 RepID=A0A316D6N8_9BACL|nr:phosphotransferase [Tumebacillus permanentifrigoris]PWK08962.1 Ser/Thr protein kinase RdoA (MazF antagonist) [Tumebacillus permanentifrigoris]
MQTSGGAMILKRYEGNGMRRRLDALADALDAVLLAGVEIAPYLRTDSGLPYIVDRNGLYTIQPWLRGRHLSLKVREERLAAARALANLHRVPAGHSSDKAFYLRVPPLWEKYRHRLEKAQLATFKDPTLRDAWRPFQQLARHAVYELQQSSLVRALDHDLQHGSLCHRDPAPHNFMWSGEGAALIDFDLSGYDVRAHDLYQLMNHALYLNGWESGLFAEMVEAYDQIMPLDVDNRSVLQSLMRYPSLVIREWYDFGKTDNHHTLRTRLAWAQMQEEKRQQEL